MITEADHKNWKADDLKPYVQHVLNLFGPDLLMFGSDWPVCRLAGTWKAVLRPYTGVRAAAAKPTGEDPRRTACGFISSMRDRRAENVDG